MHECRICLEEDECDNLIAPCNCDGTSKYVHRRCLDTWRSTSDREDSDYQCPNCLEFYEFEDVPSWKKFFRVGYKCLFHVRAVVGIGVALMGYYGVPHLVLVGKEVGLGVAGSLFTSNALWVGITLVPVVAMERILTGNWERSLSHMPDRTTRSVCLSVIMTLSPFFGSIAHGISVGLELLEIPKRRFTEARVVDLGFTEITETT